MVALKMWPFRAGQKQRLKSIQTETLRHSYHVSAPMSCYPLKHRPACFHLPYIRFISSISINTSPVITVLWSKSWVSTMKGQTDLSCAAPFPTIPSREWELPPCCSLQLKARPLPKADLPAVHTGPMEFPIHAQGESGDTERRSFWLPQSLAMGPWPPMTLQEPDELGEAQWVWALLHIFLPLPQQTWLCSFCVYFAGDELILPAGEWRNGTRS